MYNGSYDNTESTIRIPDDYGGSVSFAQQSEECPINECESAEAAACEDKSEEGAGAVREGFLPGSIGEWVKDECFAEDVMILGVAAFLFLSERGDKLAALLVLILLVVR